MEPAFLVRFRPAGPWRIGPDSGARNRVDRVFHSDTLFSAVSNAMAMVGGLEDWLAATARNPEGPAVRFSSLFPFLDDLLFVPPPRHVWPPQPSPKVRWKGARFVPLSAVSLLLADKNLDDNRWNVDGLSECLLPSSRTSGPFREAVRTHSSVDRLSGSNEARRTACLEFAPGAGLWAVVTFAGNEARDRWAGPVKAALRLLADSGFGGERSIGWGRSEMPEFRDGTMPELVYRAPDRGQRNGAAAVRVRAVEPLIAPVPEAATGPAAPEPAQMPAELHVPGEQAAPEGVAAEEAVTAAPAAQQFAGAPVAEGPGEGPAAEEPAAQAAAEELVAAPAAEEPAAKPGAEEPAAEPAAEVPGAAPAAEEPAAKAAAEEPAAEEPGAGPAGEEPAAALAAEEPAAAPAVEELTPAAAAEQPAPALAAEEPAQAPEAETPARPVEAPARPAAEPARPAPSAYWLLSMFAPSEGDSIDWKRGAYSLVTRGGRVESRARWGDEKKLLRMVEEGSVILSEAPPKGAAPDVAPDGFPHPVFRAGFAVAVPIHLRSERPTVAP